jgi:hypothetical protein
LIDAAVGTDSSEILDAALARERTRLIQAEEDWRRKPPQPPYPRRDRSTAMARIPNENLRPEGLRRRTNW